MILVHPPGMTQYLIEDSRLKQINSPFRGEIIQRMTGMFNARGTYILTVNCDEYLTPDILAITVQYFNKYPDSWAMKLSTNSVDFGDKASLEKEWGTPVNIDLLPDCSKVRGNQHLYKDHEYLLDMPIAPLENKFDIGCIFRGRKDHHGSHTENFDKKVWKNQMVQETLKEITDAMSFPGFLRYIPFWCLDRLLGLFIQAKFFESGKIIGHWLPLPEQLRTEENPPEYQRKMRFYVFAEVLLLRRFPQYGYLWNLIIHQLVEIPCRAIASIKRRLRVSSQESGSKNSELTSQNSSISS